MNDKELSVILAEATPGPWRIPEWQESHTMNLEIESDARRLQVVCCGHESDGGVSDLADARLIALAPSLAAEVLELRRKLRDAWEVIADLQDELSDEEDLPEPRWPTIQQFISVVHPPATQRMTFKLIENAYGLPAGTLDGCEHMTVGQITMKLQEAADSIVYFRYPEDGLDVR